MMIAYSYLNHPVELEKSKINVLAIENKALFRKALFCLMNGNEEQEFTLSENMQILDFSKNSFFLRDPLFPDFHDRRLKQRIETDVEFFLNDNCFEELLSLFNCFTAIKNRIYEFYDFDISSSFEPNAKIIAKMLELHPRLDETDNPIERLICFFTVMQKYFDFRLFIVADLFYYFTDKELTPFFDEITKRGIRLLTIESRAPNSKNSCNISIIDSDLCCF